MSKEQKNKITIQDFDLFYDIVKAISKFADGAKINVNQSGLTIHCKNSVARCTFTSNALVSVDELSFVITELQTFVKLMQTVKDLHEGDYSTLKFSLDGNDIRFSSKKTKLKLITKKEELITQWISQAFNTPLTPVFEFNTSSDYIKRVNSHSYILSDPNELRIYLALNPEMENNTIYATLGNNSNNMNNSLTMKFGLVTFGKLNDRVLTLDLERLNIFNMVPSNLINIQLMDKNVLVSNIKLNGKNNTYANLTIYNSLRKS